jgi:alpha-N-acetylglucosamine transferase
MSRGYLLFALNTDSTDYVKLALACALSIKITQPDGYNTVALVTNADVDHPAFDHVIPYTGPLGMDARSRAYDYTPFDETVLLDADMLFLKPMDNYWDLLRDRDLYVTTAPQNYKGKLITEYGRYRNVFAEYSWPNVYNAWTYFRKTDINQQFFNLVKDITDNSKEYINAVVPDSELTTIPTDEAFALALIILDIIDDATNPDWHWPRITHMKPALMPWSNYVSNWNGKLRFNLDSNGQVKLGVWQQAELLHYVKKELITDEIIATLEGAL